MMSGVQIYGVQKNKKQKKATKKQKKKGTNYRGTK